MHVPEVIVSLLRAGSRRHGALDDKTRGLYELRGSCHVQLAMRGPFHWQGLCGDYLTSTTCGRSSGCHFRVEVGIRRLLVTYQQQKLLVGLRGSIVSSCAPYCSN